MIQQYLSEDAITAIFIIVVVLACFGFAVLIKKFNK